MFYFIHGDSNQIFIKAQGMADSLLNKKPDAAYFKINQDNFTEDKINELLGGQGLFSNKYIVSLSRLLERSDISDFLNSKLKELKESDNIFIWTEEKITKPILRKIEKNAAQVQEFKIEKKITKPKMNIFDLANSFGEGDKKRSWVLYQKALIDFSPEEIYGTLWWKVKSMLLASKTNTPKEAEMKDFPYKKAKQFCARFNDGELDILASELIILYHQSRLRGENIALNLEKFILTK